MKSSPLNMAGEGEKLQLQRVSGDSNLQNHLASLGLVVGTELVVVRRNVSGSFIISVGDGRLALGQELVRCLWVG